MSEIRVIAILVLSCCGFVAAQPGGPDNRYCKPGNIAAFGAADGPATLPQSCFYTAVSATPSPGKEIAVTADGDLRSAISKTSCGETLVLAAGASFSGPFEFPAKGCDDDHWITVRTSGTLPAEGTRITPCYAGAASLPGRPAYDCVSPQKVMATLVVPAGGTIMVADHYRFIGLEITRVSGGRVIYSLVNAEKANKIIFDRVWIHGTPNDETARGLGFPGATYVAVVDSYFSDFHCIAATGSCVDSQTLWAGTGPVGGGTYKIVNNYLEAAAEGILFGGGPGSATPGDIEIRRNYFYKPLSWNQRDPSFGGTRFIVKNNLELKNAVRVLVEGNLLENSWGGFSQAGFQMLLTPKNQENRCPACIVKDVTIRHCLMRNSGGGMQIASAVSDAGGLSQGLMNVSIHDVVIENIKAAAFDGNGFTFQISTTGSALHDLRIDHVTVPQSDRDLLVIGGQGGSPMSNITITNSILDVGQYEVVSTGGRDNCAFQRRGPKDIFDGCWKPYAVTNNVLIGARGNWPSGNFDARNVDAVGFNSWKPRAGSDLRLKSNSHFRSKAGDGADPGADISAVEAAIAGVAR